MEKMKQIYTLNPLQNYNSSLVKCLEKTKEKKKLHKTVIFRPAYPEADLG